MRLNTSQAHITHLLSYPIASADMYYSVVNERDVYISDDPVYGFHIWGEIPGLGAKSAVDLCDMFFEYAMTCAALRDDSRSSRSMEVFANQLGERLAKYIKARIPMKTNQNPGMCALECVMEAIHAHFIVEQRDTESRYILRSCPICVASRRKNLPYADLVHLGVYKLCQCLVHAIDPFLDLDTPADSETDHIFSMVRPVFA